MTISLVQKCNFITHSNAIEEIKYPDSDSLIISCLASSKFKTYPEIRGHVNAFEYLACLPSTSNLDLQTLLTVHKLLMKGLLQKQHQGIRKLLVTVGGRMCPYPSELKPMLQIWFDKVNNLKNPTEDEVWQAHLAFEKIHPFVDGNGRSGRLLWLWLRSKYGLPFSFVYAPTKYVDYYPQFDMFNWEDWSQ